MKKNSTSKQDIIKYDMKEEVNGINFKPAKSRNYKGSLIVLAISVVLFISGIVMIISVQTNLDSCEKSNKSAKTVPVQKKTKSDICSYSKEAQRIKLYDFLHNVSEEYFNMFPEEIAWHPFADTQMIVERFVVHDPRAENIKRITDKAKLLLDAAVALKADLSELKPREHKAYLQVLHFLESTFGASYMNYTAGLWLMGPSGFCSEPICYVEYSIYNAMGSMLIYEERDIEKLFFHLKAFNESIYNYIDVLKSGIKKGMVRTKIECVAGIDALKEKHQNISAFGEEGIRFEWYGERFFGSSFYQNVTEELDKQIIKIYGKNVTQYVQEGITKYIGRSLSYLLKYLENDHIRYCRPDDIGPGGLSSLPLDFIYLDGKKTNEKTYPYLDPCDKKNCRLNGKESYRSILGYFTTTNIHPNRVHELGWENLKIIYPQVLDIAKSVTKTKNETEAVKKFQALLFDRKTNFFNDVPLPLNETKGAAFTNCNNEEKAKKNCPNRWKAMMKWFDFAQMTMSMHDPNTVDFFYFTGNRKSTPSCPVILRPNFNPSSSAQSYDNSDINCTYPCQYNIPFFLEDLGPKSSEFSVNAHEARPGHHTQVQGLVEHFRDKCGGPEGWLDDKTYYTAFTEGWALYAENPLIAQSTNVYDNNPMQKYGMFKWQIWRALRLIVDTGLHYKGYTRQKALDLFEKYAWDSSDLGKKEVTRYQSNYGQATAYMIGQLDIWRLRNQTQKALKENFSLKEFHLQTLSQGSSPLAYLSSHINKYIDCKKNPTARYCDIVLDPTKRSKDSTPFERNKGMYYPRHRHHI